MIDCNDRRERKAKRDVFLFTRQKDENNIPMMVEVDRGVSSSVFLCGELENIKDDELENHRVMRLRFD